MLAGKSILRINWEVEKREKAPGEDDISADLVMDAGDTAKKKKNHYLSQKVMK